MPESFFNFNVNFFLMRKYAAKKRKTFFLIEFIFLELFFDLFHVFDLLVNFCIYKSNKRVMQRII